VHAIGAQFTHALKSLRKTVDDLPLIAIDDYRHLLAFDGKVDDIRFE
jgi:hypothetical protein